MIEVRALRSNRLSHYRTDHEFTRYGEFDSPQAFLEYRRWAQDRGLPLLILGNGSNTLFRRRRVRSLVVRNRLPQTLREVDPHAIEVSSSVPIAQVLAWCQARGLDSCWYLASVPATLGGAIAMNAGRGRQHGLSIFDYVEAVTFLDGEAVQTLRREEIPIGYRQTPFTGQTSDLILHAVLRFPQRREGGNPARERVEWSRQHQDHGLPNCGSVFKESDPKLMRRLRGRRLHTASYSARTANWILSSGPRSWPIVWLIRLTRWAHRVRRRPCSVELIEVD